MSTWRLAHNKCGFHLTQLGGGIPPRRTGKGGRGYRVDVQMGFGGKGK